MLVTCSELVSRKRLDGGYRYRSEAEIRDLARRANERTDLPKYRRLQSDGRRLISGWFEKAWAERDCEPENSFEPFVFAFIAMNAWASCVTSRDADREWRDALALNRIMGADFDRFGDRHIVSRDGTRQGVSSVVAHLRGPTSKTPRN